MDCLFVFIDFRHGHLPIVFSANVKSQPMRRVETSDDAATI